jgi:hypothetical protein
VRRKVVHGSDWPIPSLATLKAGLFTALRQLLTEGNWVRRDVRIKRAVGFDEDYFLRAGTLLRMAPRSGPTAP